MPNSTDDSYWPEIAASGKLIGKVDYTLSGNVFYNRIDAANLGFTGTRSNVGYEAKGALNWHAGAKDTLQVNLATQGRRLTPQATAAAISRLISASATS